MTNNPLHPTPSAETPTAKQAEAVAEASSAELPLTVAEKSAGRPGDGALGRPGDGPRGRVRWAWVAAGLLAVVALGSGAFAAVRDGEDAIVSHVAAAPSSPSGNVVERTEEDAQLTHVGADGAFIVSVTGLRCGVPAVGPAELRQSAKGEFCLVEVAVENAGREPRLLDGSAQRAVDIHRRAYAVDDRAAAFLNERVPSLLDEIPADTTVRGVLPFGVPAGTRLSALLVHEAAGTRGARISLN